MNKASKNELLSSGLLFKNSLFNFGGKTFSLVVAIVAIPLIISFIGTERFGILSIAWIILGYVGILDLGIGRALTKYLSEQINSDKLDQSGPLIGSAILISLGVGLVLMVVLFLAAPSITGYMFNIEEALEVESQRAIQILAFSLLFNILAIDFRAILEAFQLFKITSFVQSISTSFAYLGLAAISFFTVDLSVLTLFLTIIKICTCLVFGYAVFNIFKENSVSISFNTEYIKLLFKYGSWITVSNFISPLMDYIDRFFIGSFITMTAVSYYTTSFDLVQKLNVIPTSLVVVLFPALSARSDKNKDETNNLIDNSQELLQVVIFPLIVFIILFSDEILILWLNEEFARNSGLVLQILCVGAYFNNIAQIYFTNIQAANRPDLTAKIHFVEFPIYTLAMYIFTLKFGIIGAAFTRMFRVIIDQCLLLFISSKISDMPTMWFKYTILPFFGVGLLAIGEYVLVPSLLQKILIMIPLGIIYLVLSKQKLLLLYKKFILLT